MVLGLLLIRFDFFCRKIKRKRSVLYKCVTWSILIIVLFVISIYKLITTSNHPLAVHKTYIYIQPLNSFFLQRNNSRVMHDWNDYQRMEKDAKRSGYGEQGMDTYIDGQDPHLEEKLIAENGHNVLVSDMISLDRAIPDYRSEECKDRRYFRSLPKVSIVIPFYDEHETTLLRTLHSIMNRTPKELLNEIIMVNDASEKSYEKLEYHIMINGWDKKVKIFEMDEQSGVIWSRLAGARLASGSDVIVFLDCHVEVGYNWLPPLLEPIAKNYRTVVVPTMDIIDKRNYQILPLSPGRTVFDWHFHAQRIPLRKKDLELSKDEPYVTPVIFGSSFAVSTRFFWELRPDSGLITYGPDFLEISFKVNLCGGILYESPCSRVSHLYRRFPHEKHDNDIDFKAANNKRVAEIWLDEYKQYLYSRHPERYKRIIVEEEDIQEQLEIKHFMKCQPFSYFINEVAPDMLDRYPLEEFPHFAAGAIRAYELNDTCLEISGDTDFGDLGRLKIALCDHDVTHPHQHQYFILRHFRDIQIRGRSDCLEAGVIGNFFTYDHCQYEQGDQYFRYDINTLQIYWGPKRNNICLDIDLENDLVVGNICDEKSMTQKFVWGTINYKFLQDWVKYGAPILDKDEIIDLLEG